MSARKGKSKKKNQKSVVIVEKQVPNFDHIQDVTRDSLALIVIAYKILMTDAEEDHGDAIAVLDHGQRLLKQGCAELERANLRLGRFCRQNKLPQESAS
jgi:hypothetical protein